MPAAIKRQRKYKRGSSPSAGGVEMPRRERREKQYGDRDDRYRC